MYSKSFVGEPKKRDPSAFGTWGESTRSRSGQVSRRLGLGDEARQGVERPPYPAQDLLDLGHSKPVADEEEVHLPLLEPRGRVPDEGAIVRARTSVPCQRPNVPTNVATVASSAIP